MENKCIVRSCGANDVDLFISPQDLPMLKKWQAAVLTQSEEFFVCEKHFAPKDLVLDKTLEDEAVPILHLTKERYELEDDCCGICLDELDERLELDRELQTIFMEITKFEVKMKLKIKGS